MNFKLSRPFFKLLSGAAALLCLNANAQKSGINASYMDQSVNPRDDFYSYCNGKWQKNFVLPESDARYGSFNEIHENNLKKIKLILDAASANKTAARGSDAQKLRDFYLTAMDTAKADALGFKPIQPMLQKLDAVNSLAGFLQLKCEYDLININLLFNTYVAPDLKNSMRNRFYLSQGGYGLGDRDYYLSPRFENIRKEYKNYLTQLFAAVGSDAAEAASSSEKVFQFELKMAEASLSREEMRDLEKTYNIYPKVKLSETTPSIDWNSYFKNRNMATPDTVIVGMTDYLKNIETLLKNNDINLLKLYAKAQLLMQSAPYLSTSVFEKIHFAFRGKIMSGAKKMKPRWQRVQGEMDGTMGDIVSQEFVKKYFPAEAKVKINKLIDNLVAAYRERLATRDWMSAEAKVAANKKLDLLIRKIGYPDKWKNYKSLEITTESYWSNVCRANHYVVQDNQNELNKPVDRSKWQMTPVTVNAYYDPTTNEITFPAAILQPPFYDPSADDAANYGTMGSIIGHELTHGFDDQGSQFDASGNMKMWWNDSDLKNFKSKTEKIIEQFNNYTLLDSLHVNGNMTQGENIADLGGLTMAYRAYMRSLGGTKSKMIDGLTGEQRFFVAWTQGWKAKVRDEETKRLLTVDYHSPAYLRAFAPLTNMKEFYEAFGIKPGDKMYRADDKRVEIW